MSAPANPLVFVRWSRRGIGGVFLECSRVAGLTTTTRRALRTFAEQIGIPLLE